MKVTGHQLKESYDLARMNADNLSDQFYSSLTAFSDEKDNEDKNPVSISEQLMHTYRKVAKIQEAQSYYNLQVKVSLGQDKMTLAEVVRLVCSANNFARIWKNAVYSDLSRRNSNTRDKDSEYAKDQISRAEAVRHATLAKKYSIRLQNSISKGNSTEVDIPFLNQEILE